MIAIVDYGMGNLKSVMNAFEAIGKRAFVTKNPSNLASAGAIIVGGEELWAAACGISARRASLRR